MGDMNDTKLNENFEGVINLWGPFYVIICILITTLSSFVGRIFFLSFINYTDIYVLIVLITIYVFFVAIRNKLIKIIYEKLSHITLLNIVRVLSIILFTFVILIVVIFIDSYFYVIFTPERSRFILLIFSAFLFYIPIFLMFNDMLTANGKIKINFIQLYSNFDDFFIRQIWMQRIFKRLGSDLKEGNIKIDHNKIIYHLNMKNMNDENVVENIKEIEKWMIENTNDKGILKSLEKIIPRNEIKYLEKKPIKSYFNWINPEYVKLIFFIIIALIVFIYKPELLNAIVNQLSP